MTDIITERFSDGVLRIQLNRPEKKNAMTTAMYGRLAEIFDEAGRDDSVRVVLWHGAGASFTAGNDISDFRDNPPEGGKSPQIRLTNALMQFEKPIVVAVQGVAIGGGTTMLTHCDFVYAGESTRFQVPLINLALTPEFGSSFSIPERAGHLAAAELFMLGEPFSAAQAAALGLVTRVEPDSDVLAKASAIARKLAEKPGSALRAHKRLIKRSAIGPFRDAVEAEAQEFITRVRSPEAKEAFSAFLEKRPPNFTKLATAGERNAA